MTTVGYAGMLGTLAFVLALVLLVAKAARRFLPGAHRSGSPNDFAIIQRIPLGQRQAVAILQRGDTLIGLSVGDGGVRTLFTAPAVADMAVASADAAAPSELRILSDDEMRDLTQHAGWPGVAASAIAEPAAALVPALPLKPVRRPSFRTAFGAAIRKSAALSLLLAVAASLVQAQQAATAPAPRPTAPAPAGRTPQQPAANGALRTLPPAPAQAGPRDLPVRATPKAVSPKPATPAATGSRTGGAATIAPLIPAAQAKGIAAQKAAGANDAPVTTAEAQRITSRADSMIGRLAPQLDLKFGQTANGEGLRMSGTVGVVVMMGLLSLLPVLLLMMTGFTRILIVLHFLKQALGTQTAPPGQLVAGMALLLSGFVMAPTLTEVNRTALEPWMDGQIEQVEMMQRASVPFKGFMLRQVRDQDLQTFVDLADIPQPATREAVPLHILMSAFVTSELRTSFQIGFALFLPFIIIDVVVGSVLMSMGMVMLPPALISLPFKLLLFVLVDGWGLVITGLVQSFK